MTTTTQRRAVEYLSDHRSVIEHALRNETISAREDEQAFRRVAEALRAGARHWLFAPGEPGVRAADGIADSHHRRQVTAEAALAALETLDEEA
jgi:hypothetical protein